MDTQGATAVDQVVLSGEPLVHLSGAASQQPILNITLKESDLKGISVFLKESCRGELRDEVCAEMGLMIKGIVDGVLKGLNERIDSLNTKINSLKSENNSLKEENEKLRTRVYNLKSATEAAEQYSRRNSLRVTGVRETEHENTDTIILDMTRALGVEMDITEIDRSDRVGKRKSPNHVASW